MRKKLIEKDHPQLSARRQSNLLNVNRNRLSPTVRKSSPEEMALCSENAHRRKR